MNYSTWLSLDKEIARINADATRWLQGESFQDRMNDYAENYVANMEATRFRNLAEELLAPTAQELMQSIYRSPLESFGKANSMFALDTAFQDSLVDIGAAALSVNTFIDQVQERSLQSFDVNSLFPSLGVGSFMEPLPDLARLARLFDEEFEEAITEGEAALDESGYGFATELFTERYLASMAWITQSVRSATVTNKLAAYTRQSAFREELQSRIEQATVLKRRWPVIDRALRAHSDKDYLLSIPALLPQVEGAMRDALLLKGSLLARKGKLYRKDPNGPGPKLDKHGKPIEISSAGAMLQGSPLAQHPLLQMVSDVLTNGLLAERNDILHGRKLNYKSAGLSLRALLILSAIAPDLAAFEAGDI